MYQTYLKWYFLVFVMDAENPREKLSARRSYLILGTFFTIWNLSCSQVPLKNIYSRWAFNKIMNFSWRNFFVKKSLLIPLFYLNFFQRNLKMVFWYTCVFLKESISYRKKVYTDANAWDIAGVNRNTLLFFQYVFRKLFFEAWSKT